MKRMDGPSAMRNLIMFEERFYDFNGYFQVVLFVYLCSVSMKTEHNSMVL